MLVSIQPWVPEFDPPKRASVHTGVGSLGRDGVAQTSWSRVCRESGDAVQTLILSGVG